LGSQAIPFTRQPKVLAPVCVMGGNFSSSVNALPGFDFLQLAASRLAVSKMYRNVLTFFIFHFLNMVQMFVYSVIGVVCFNPITFFVVIFVSQRGFANCVPAIIMNVAAKL
jgi:hypothetical protein